MRMDRMLGRSAALALLLLGTGGAATGGVPLPAPAGPRLLVLVADSTQPTRTDSGSGEAGQTKSQQGAVSGQASEDAGFGALERSDEIAIDRMLSDNRLVGATAAEAWLRTHPNAFAVFPAGKRTAALVLFMRKAAERNAASTPDAASAETGESPAVPGAGPVEPIQGAGEGAGLGWAGVPASYQEGWDQPGNDYANLVLPEANPKICWFQCIQDDRCVAWVYVKPGVQGEMAACWFKNGWSSPVASDCCTSGAKSASDRAAMSKEAKAKAEMEAMEEQMLATEPDALGEGGAGDGTGDSGGYGGGSSGGQSDY